MVVVMMVVTMRVTLGIKMGTLIGLRMFRMGMCQPARLNPKDSGKQNQAGKQTNHQVSGDSIN